MKNNKYDNITIGLAGIVQALSLVRELAHTGKMNETAFQASIRSIFETQPQNALVVYGDLQNIELGLEKIVQAYTTKTSASRTTISHLLAVIRLQRKISRSPKLLTTLSQRIQQAKKQAEYFSMTHTNVLANLGDAYLNMITAFGLKFFLMGNQRYLSVRENVDKIRSLLLAALRAAVLWRQSGGSRWQFLFSNKKIKASAERLLAQLKEQQRNISHVVS